MKTKDELLVQLRPTDAKKFSAVQNQALMKWQIAVEDFCHELFENVPECADRTVAARKLLELKFYGVQAITHVGFEKKKEVKKSEEKAGEKEDLRESGANP